MRKYLFILLPFIMFACNNKNTDVTDKNKGSDNEQIISQIAIDEMINELVNQYGDSVKERIIKGVTQTAKFWRNSDGSEKEFKLFCTENFIKDDEEKEMAYKKLSRNYEILWGNFQRISLALNEPLDLDVGELSPVDMMFGSYSASAHLDDDFYNNKIAFFTTLNFPSYTLDEKTKNSENWSRLEWAYARMGDIYSSRIPAEVNQVYSTASTNAGAYIADYNIFMGKLINDKNETLFPEDMKLITHWGLRDELKSNYRAERGLEKQQMVYDVMKNIISQDIPKLVINSGEYQWNPKKNTLHKDGKEIEFEKEPDTRYEQLLTLFKAEKSIDKFDPVYGNYIDRRFSGNMEIPQKEVEELFTELVSSPQVKEVAKLISKRLERNLEPFDIWYDGFTSSNDISEEELDKITKAKYPTADALKKDLPVILKKLGFQSDRAEHISSKILVDPSRGAGHASGAVMKSDFAHLRTRVGSDGMNYKGYNIAIHEFGHNVEQTLTLYDIDHYMLNGVPNTAFTEALAFIFQKRDLELLGMKSKNPNKMHLQALDNFWSCYEIMGVSLVDMKVWKWMYDNPEATPAELKKAVIDIAVEVWNKYYADVFGIKDQPILAIYSHMISYPLYLSAYPVGHLIDFQLEKYIADKNFATEVERIYSAGRIIPQAWMKAAVQEKLSNKPLLEAVDEALKSIE